MNETTPIIAIPLEMFLNATLGGLAIGGVVIGSAVLAKAWARVLLTLGLSSINRVSID